MNSNSLQRLALVVLRTALVLALVVVTTSIAGTPGKEEPGADTAGFSSGTWGGPAWGQEHFNKTHYQFGIIDAASGLVSHLCDGTGNIYFEDAVETLVDANRTAHAFWFLASYYTGTQLCGYSEGPQKWGRQQADNFIDYVDDQQQLGNVVYLLGDVEYVNDPVGCAIEPSGCCFDNEDPNIEADAAGWDCASDWSAQQVILGFFVRLWERYSGVWQAVYTSTAQWETITGGATAADVHVDQVWMAAHYQSQTTLDENATKFADWGFSLWGWQYTDDCSTDYLDARDMVRSSTVRIERWDMWTNSTPYTVCGIKQGTPAQ